MKNFIGLNIKHLYEENKLSQNEFGEMFDLKKGVISTYVNGKTNPQIETIQKICEHFNVSLDDFINRNLRTLRVQKIWSEASNEVNEPTALRGSEEAMQKTIETQEKYITMLEAEIKRLKGNKDYNSKTA